MILHKILKYLIITAFILLECQHKTNAQQNFFCYDTLTKATPWTNLRFNTNNDKFQFLIVSDLTGGYRQGIFPDAIDKINELQPEFVMSIGDLIEGYTEDTIQLNYCWNKIQSWTSKINCPFFYTPGNHDLSNPTMQQQWKKRFGESYYSFSYKKTLFIILNTETYGEGWNNNGKGHINKEQVEYLKNIVNQEIDAQHIYLFFHRPVWQKNDKGFLEIEKFLKNKDYTVFAGHTHTYKKSIRNGHNYYILSTTGGGSPLTGADFGSFDHLTWVTAKNDTTIVTNIALKGIISDSICTEFSEPYANNFIETTESISHLPIFLSSDNSGNYQTTITLKNHCTTPLHFTGRFFQHDKLWVNKSTIDTIINGLESLKVSLIISPHKAVSPKTEPISLNWEMQTNAAGRTFKMNGNYSIKILPVDTFETAPANISIDGCWNEWDKPEWKKLVDIKNGWTPESYHGINDCAIAVHNAYKNDSIFFALYVKDNNQLYSNLRESCEQDGARLTIITPSGKSIFAEFSPGEDDNMLFNHKKNWAQSAILKVKKQNNGFVAEIALSVNDLKENKRPDYLKLQWTIFDHDNNEINYAGTKGHWLIPYPENGRFLIPFSNK